VITLWHNQRCSKSRAALALVEATGKPFVLRRYLEDAPAVGELRAVLTALGHAPALSLVRTGEPVFRDLGLSKQSSEDELIEAMSAHPILIERPVLIVGAHARIGRPTEALHDLL
jgi:arsenate reductase